MLETFKDILVCPYSLGPLIFQEDKLISEMTKDEYPIVKGQVNLRLQRPKNYNMNIVLGAAPDTTGVDFKNMGMNPNAEINYDDIPVPHHLSREILSYFPKAKNSEGYVLDLGCGTGLHKEVCERTGFQYIGLDYNSRAATILASGEALPFKDNSIDFVISITVLEHVQHPMVMAKEVYRVLKPGGRLIGTLAFLEPFHDNSYYHHSHLGLLNTLRIAEFNKIIVIAASETWQGIHALAIMHYFSRMPWTLARAIITPVYWLHRIWWKFVEFRNRPYFHPFNEHYRVLAASGGFMFVVDK